MRLRRIAAVALVGGAAIVGPVAVAAPANACVWDAAWFFFHQCNPSPPPQGPPQPPQPMIACDETHCGPDVPIPCSGPGTPC